eukprot:6485525-Amphidinium_carterae.1
MRLLRGPPHRNPASKYYEPVSAWPTDYPPAMYGGPGYLLAERLEYRNRFAAGARLHVTHCVVHLPNHIGPLHHLPPRTAGRSLVQRIITSGIAEKHILFGEDRAVGVWTAQRQRGALLVLDRGAGKKGHRCEVGAHERLVVLPFQITVLAQGTLFWTPRATPKNTIPKKEMKHRDASATTCIWKIVDVRQQRIHAGSLPQHRQCSKAVTTVQASLRMPTSPFIMRMSLDSAPGAWKEYPYAMLHELS